MRSLDDMCVDKKRILVTMIEFDTAANRQTSIEERLDILSDAVDLCRQELYDTPRAGVDAAIVLAPEYYFSRPIDMEQRLYKGVVAPEDRANVSAVGGESLHSIFGSIRQLESDERAGVVDRIRELSQSCPDSFLIPGTIAWRKGGDGDYWGQVGRAKLDRYFKDMGGHQEKQIYGYGMPAPQMPKDKQSYIKDYDLKENLYFARNTAGVYHGGKKVYRQHKITDITEVTHPFYTMHEKTNPDTLMRPGDLREGGVYEFKLDRKRLSMTIEICADHNDGFRAKLLGGRLVDLNIILSASVETNLKSCPVKPDGYVVHCSSKYTRYDREMSWRQTGCGFKKSGKHAGVWRRTSKEYVPTQPIAVLPRKTQDGLQYQITAYLLSV